MPSPIELASAFRAAYLRELWRRLGAQYPAASRSIALFGAGRHTQYLLETVRNAEPAPRIEMILDDRAGADQSLPPEIGGIPVRSPAKADPGSIACVVVSSDSMEANLAERARAWMKPHAALVAPYADLPRGPYPAPVIGGKAFANAWGNNTRATNNHLPIAPDEPTLRLTSARDADLATGSDGLPLPPPGLRAGYNPHDDALYFSRGNKDAAIFRSLVSRHADFASINRILDWGCCTGRLIRHFADVARKPGALVMGADVCAQSIDWAHRHLHPPFSFVTTTLSPPLPFADGQFDLVYSCSVFTHIRELWDTWLAELRRVIRPGGYLITTILDEQAFLAAPPNLVARCPGVDFSKPLSAETDMLASGTTHDPLVYWTREGVSRRWSPIMEVVEFQGGVQNQTAVLLRRRD